MKITIAFVYCCMALHICCTVADIANRECTDIDIRNECSSFQDLEGCTVVKGTLKIVLIPSGNSHELCNYTEYRFPMLREITDYLIFFDVRGLTSIRDLFPNLTVIRGRRLFLNYALGISNMPDLQTLEFKSLVAIQRGHVYIGSGKKLCQLEKINFERLTISPGENHIIPVNQEKCPIKSVCKGCTSDYCWSNTVCQKFENDNVINLTQGSNKCDAECLGGCYNSQNSGCVVCKGITDHGACVSECPQDKYFMEHHMRCYTREECIEDYEHYIHENQCVKKCPSGFTEYEATSDCVRCSPELAHECVNICQPDYAYDALFTIFTLSDAERLKNCRVLNGSLVITIRNKIDEKQLIHAFSDVREIYGHLKIYRSQYLTSLKFLRNLQIIHGEPLENDLYAIIIYDNSNLQELWQMREENLSLRRGSMYIHLNNKLCNQVLQKFRAIVEHDRSMDTVQISDQEVLCGPEKLNLDIDILSHQSMRLYWPTMQTVEKVEILYRYIPPKTKLLPESELDTHICRRIDWIRRLKFSDEIVHNDTHYSFDINDLQSHTQYEVLVKTFDGTGERDARSEVKSVQTDLDIPPPPAARILNTTETTIQIEIKIEHFEHNFCPNCMHYYVMNIYEMADDVSALDQRNFCKQPIILYTDEPEDGDLEAQSSENNYEECCAREQEKFEENYFFARMRQEYACNRNHAKNCVPAAIEALDEPHLVRRLHLSSDVKNFTVDQLTFYTQYILQLKSCNTIGCSAFTMVDARTRWSQHGDRLKNLHACYSARKKEYYVYFGEPDKPNGAILSYVIHYRLFKPSDNKFLSNMVCISRKDHALNNYRYVANFQNSDYNEVAVRVYSIAGEAFTKWKNITQCTADEEDDNHGEYTASFSHLWHRAYLFIYAIIFGGSLTMIWILYKLRYWHRFILYYRNWLTRDNVNFIRLREHRTMPEDQQILVDDFETVRFRNNPESENLNIAE